MASPSETPVLAEGDNFTHVGNDTLVAPAPILKVIQKLGFLSLELKIVISAMAIIYIGAHGALRRPPSASPAKSGKKKKEDQFAEGFTPSDAILLPVLAGFVLIGLYYIIKWIQDPSILNKILQTYMSVVGVISLSKLLGDTLEFVTSMFFPSMWRDSQGQIFHIDGRRRCQELLIRPQDETSERRTDTKKTTPLAGFLSERSFSARTQHSLWKARHLLTEKWIVRVAVHGIGKESFPIKLVHVIGILLAMSTTFTYSLTGATLLSNLMGAGFCYGTSMIMSCTSFATGSLVLLGLFVYDIVMVFYTPYMITVAKTIDAPIKLVFEGPSGASLLGLGDIVIPGIFICLALRFDLWQYYQKKAKYVPTSLETVSQDPSSEQTVTTTETQYRTVKPTFVDPQGRWGDRLWTSTWLGIFFGKPATPTLAAAAFPKPYFYASMFGYFLGMLTTLAMLIIFRHGQPALLYLVPGVVGSTWLTGLVRGELKAMWTYTEDGSLDTEDVVVELDADGRVVKEISSKKEGDDEAKEPKSEKDLQTEPTTSKKEEKAGEQGQADVKASASNPLEISEKGYDVFLFSISAPGTKDLKED
ncbi:putative signal peptide peptidase protein [Phaeoacremonium minimum UCRPA7]|uniref:Putative signal peptide peptidase protein n=1 Tax=Phaeoacremonium minimum (strain UCR-PA7) TaxID=1286976 RepID=R8B9F9_PHAM7|nr:putative signal peptide peptidase protein [Phaeoacremonium minimum UCRPA7]EON95921.1 putative signal peptide peptidase protein [Phaeoacremonium minimum UCRPA7]